MRRIEYNRTNVNIVLLCYIIMYHMHVGGGGSDLAGRALPVSSQRPHLRHIVLMNVDAADCTAKRVCVYVYMREGLVAWPW